MKTKIIAKVKLYIQRKNKVSIKDGVYSGEIMLWYQM